MYFELFVDDLGRAAAFYAALFGWACRGSGEDRFEIYEGDGTASKPIGAFRKRTGTFVCSARLQTHVNGAVLQWPVASVELALSKAASLGGVAAREPTQLPNGDLYAYIVDSEGNHLAVREGASKH